MKDTTLFIGERGSEQRKIEVNLTVALRSKDKHFGLHERCNFKFMTLNVI